MRFLLVNNHCISDPIAGVTQSLRTIVEWLADAGHQCHVLTTARFESAVTFTIEEHLAQQGVPPAQLAAPSARRRSSARRSSRHAGARIANQPVVHYTVKQVPVTLLLTRHNNEQQPDRSEASLVFQAKQGSYDTASLIEFLTDLHDHLDGQPVTLIWDGLPAHRSKAMKAWLATQRQWLVTEQLPGYAPDLNPVELVWGNIKATELANLCPQAIDEAHTAAETGLVRIGSSYQLCFAFLDHTGLSL